MHFDDIKVETSENIGILTLNRPAHGNAVRLQTLQEICRALDLLIEDVAVKAIVLRSEGKHFCAGAEFSFLDSLSEMEPNSVQTQIYTYFQGAARRLYNCLKPTLALVSGYAVTVGCELALACDFRLVSNTAMLQESWIKLGLMPPLGGLFLLPRHIGLAKAKRMMLRGDPLTATEAVESGLALEMCDREALDQRGMAVAQELCDLAPIAYRSIKQALHRGLETSMEAEWSANVFNQAVLLSTGDFKEGLAAVKEKRKPKFSGS